MRLINRKKLIDFKLVHADVVSQVDTWTAIASEAEWKRPHDIKNRYATASFLADNHIVFNLKGNKYRLLVQVNYGNKIIYIKKIGTHNEYMKWKIN